LKLPEQRANGSDVRYTVDTHAALSFCEAVKLKLRKDSSEDMRLRVTEEFLAVWPLQAARGGTGRPVKFHTANRKFDRLAPITLPEMAALLSRPFFSSGRARVALR
jgi:hypothetical protein